MAVFPAESLDDRTRYGLFRLASSLTFVGMIGIIKRFCCITMMADWTNPLQLISGRFKAVDDRYGMYGMLGMKRQSGELPVELVIEVDGRSIVAFMVMNNVFACVGRP